ncbi:hypothetical protein [Rhodopirellula sp. SWK7]|uniref:hypothetical protein n=1 Tax=Rhodopirellula sp. SWK7 TaxID=595460 RepID=UPI0002BD6A64|nr:hypothetical protein [Rhodopirellula sp. SWK7]EMI44104.1 hypothetical protein RRSWK_03429 [Rhodopirellula sp. SWK7]
MDADKIKDFFIHHAEKMVVGLVMLASAWMVYGGLSMPDMTKEQDPDKLANEAKQVRASIDDDHTEAIIPPREPTFDIDAELAKKNEYVAYESFNPDKTWIPIPLSESTRRQDPTLLAPRALLTSSHIESYAVLGNGNYRVKELEPAEKLEMVEQKKKPKPKKPRGRRGMMGMDDMMEMEMEMMDPGMMDPGMMGPGMMDPSMMGPGMMDPGMMGSGMTGPIRTLAPEYNFGYRTNSTTTSGVPGTETKQPIPQSAWFIAGTAVIPHKEIAESYKAALFDADGFLPQRDQPFYFNYEIQRANVTKKTVDQLVEEDWVLIGSRESDLKRAAFVWAGYAPELVPIDYRDLNVTGYIPPILLSDYSKFALHPLIPMETRQQIEDQKLYEESQQVVEINPDEMELADPNATGTMGGMGGDMGYDYSMMDMDMDMGMSMGMGMGVAAGMQTLDENPVEYKLMRFYDFARRNDKLSPMPGQSYVYRIRYAVQDPNFPANPLQQPKSATLSADVYARVQGLMLKAEETKKRDFQRWSPWSEASPPAELPTLSNLYAGPVEPTRPRTFNVAGKKIDYYKSPPKVDVLNFAHNATYAAPMPLWLNKRTEGSSLSFKGTADIIDPLNMQIKKVEEAEVLSTSTVIDLEGGAPLAIFEDEELTEPGMMLIFDEYGGLKVQDEVQDQEKYRIYSFAKERGI